MDLSAPSTLEPWGKARPSLRARAVLMLAAISCFLFYKTRIKRWLFIK